MSGFLIVTTLLVSAIAADSETSMSCDFERDTCGFTNQEGLTAVWERKEVELDGKKSYMMVFEANETDTSATLAKLITPYFELTEGSYGCLSFDLYVSGEMHFVVQQERNIGIIPVWIRSKNEKPGWSRPRLDTYVDESTRFFYEILFEAYDKPFVALDNVRLDFKKC